jgi:Galactose oxidase, central domain
MQWTQLTAACAACARTQHTAVYDAASNCVVVFGGYSVQAGHLSDLLVIDVQRGESWLPTERGDLPVGRRGHVAQVIGGRMFVFGGANTDKMLQDTLCLSLTTWTWETIPVTGNIPAARRGAASCTVDDRFLLVHGGFDGSRCLDDLHFLDTVNLCWTKVHVNDCAGTQPGPRALHAMCSLSNGQALIMHGGACNRTVLSSVAVLHNPALTDGLRLAVEREQLVDKLASLHKRLALAESVSATEQGALKVAQAQNDVRSPRPLLGTCTQLTPFLPSSFQKSGTVHLQHLMLWCDGAGNRSGIVIIERPLESHGQRYQSVEQQAKCGALICSDT